ncbi:pentapeptide repeat-containing protein [Allokutzneria oryzae]|uniref:Pentapeptide repeat-containing protein n=1 Tax=Allokutzneria oryzae TaxID=1378989 RepID=A0ABV6A2I0_9PSEU
MDKWVILIAGSAISLCAVVLLLTGWSRTRQGLLLTGTVLAAIGLLGLVGGWLLIADPKAGPAEAIKTGGLAGGAVVALYALWLNDRKRRAEEDRNDHDRERVSDERFARSVEMLGNEADQVRVGALHALAGLAKSRPDYTQTVLEIICSYLRRPFSHEAFDERGDDPNRYEPDERDADADRERQVRQTAQRLLHDLLPERGTDGPAYDLDLTGARLEYLELRNRRVGRLVARYAEFLGITRWQGAEFTQEVLLTSAHFKGRAEVHHVVFHNGVSLLDASFDRELNLSGSKLEKWGDLRAKTTEINHDGFVIGKLDRFRLPERWSTEEIGQNRSKLITP